MDKFRVLAISKENLENSIVGLSGLKPILQKQAMIGNGRDKKQGEIDAKELGEHFETAINSMITLLGFMED